MPGERAGSLITEAGQEDTVTAVQKLKAKGVRFRSKGLRILIAAGVLAVICLVDFAVYNMVVPATSFTTLDLTDAADLLKKVSESSVQESFPTFAGGGAPFDSAVNKLMDTMSGPVPKGVMILGIVIAGLAMAFGEVPMASFLLPALVFALGSVSIIPLILKNAGPSSSTPNSSGYVQQLIDDKRYTELAKSVSERMPGAQAAYVKAQLFYLDGKKDLAKDALVKFYEQKGQWNAIKGGSTSPPDWDRIGVVEMFSFGSLQSSEAIKKRQDYEEYKAVLKEGYVAGTGITTLVGLAGFSLFGIGIALTRRSRRLEEMLGITQTFEIEAAPGGTTAKAVPDQSQKFTPAWQKVQPESRVTVTAESGAFTDGLLAGVIMGASTSSAVSSKTDLTSPENTGNGDLCSPDTGSDSSSDVGE